MTGPCHTPDACEPDSCWVCAPHREGDTRWASEDTLLRFDGDEWVEVDDTGHETGCRCDGCDEDRAFDARRDDAREAYDDARFDHEIETTKGVHND